MFLIFPKAEELNKRACKHEKCAAASRADELILIILLFMLFVINYYNIILLLKTQGECHMFYIVF
jgi:hypothetical protein